MISFFISLKLFLDFLKLMFNRFNIFFSLQFEISQQGVLMIKQQSESDLKLFSHISKLFLCHFNLVVQRINSEERNSFFNQLSDFHEFVFITLSIQLFSHDQIVKDVTLMLDIELFVLITILFLQFNQILLLSI